MAEFATSNKQKDLADKSLNVYKTASEVGDTKLPPAHPIPYAHSTDQMEHWQPTT
jgi:14-3-3 protein epsilon